MGLFKGKDKNTVIDLINTAIKDAESFGKKFDFSKASIADLDDILEYYNQEIVIKKPAEDRIHRIALIFGAYLGESILKNGAEKSGYKWKDSKSGLIGLVLYKDDKYQMAPVSKVYKRLVNGPEDNVVSFFDIALYIAEHGSIR